MCTPGTRSAVPLLDPAGAHTWQRDAQEPVTTTFRRSPLKLSRYELEGAIHLRNPLEQDLLPSRHSLGHSMTLTPCKCAGRLRSYQPGSRPGGWPPQRQPPRLALQSAGAICLTSGGCLLLHGCIASSECLLIRKAAQG